MLTINQLMALLAIHRGTFCNELKLGTAPQDLTKLQALGLVQVISRKHQEPEHSTTNKGEWLIGRIKNAVVSADCMTNTEAGWLTGSWKTDAELARENKELKLRVSVEGIAQVSMDYEGPRGCQVADEEFYLVTSGECHGSGAGPGGKRPYLKSPPSVIHGSRSEAGAEASRLAGLNEGLRFFVLRAVEVHRATKPVTVKEL